MEIIAEIGQNHNGDMELAKKLIRSAKNNGADAAKFQVFDADKTFGKANNPWYEYNRKTQLTCENVLFFADECAKAGIEFLASVFNPDRVKWLEKAGVKRYKIASRSINDRELIEAVASTGKPMIVSLGHWYNPGFPEIKSAAKVSFLYCIAKYPANFTDLKLSDVDFKKYAGFSDHTAGITASQVAISRGAQIIEKHFTLDKSYYGPDHSGSMTPDELRQIHEFRLKAVKCL